MDRRTILKQLGMMLGGVVTLPASVLAAAFSPAIPSKNIPPNSRETLVAALAEQLIPETHTPGAKAAGVPAMMLKVLEDCYPKTERARFLQGLEDLEAQAKTAYNKPFTEASEAEQVELMRKLDAVSAAQMKEKGKPAHYFRMFKELALFCYFSSEAGATQTLRYVPIPGKSEGCVPYKKGDRAFYNPW